MPNIKAYIGKLILILGGSLTGFLVVAAIYPLILPPANQRMAGVQLEVSYTTGMGDLFVHQPHLVAPPPDPYQVLSQHVLVWDEDGFRLPAQPAETYQVLALGDSFTEAANVALPWPDILAQKSGLSVRNLGFRGYGPLEQAEVMRTFGVNSGADIVIIGFFGGNDLTDARASLTEGGFNLPSIARQAFTGAAGNEEAPWDNDFEGPFPYPVQVEINQQRHDIAFYNGYLWRLNDAEDKWASSPALDATVQSWRDISEAAGDACVIIAYFPSKPQVYLPYVAPEYRDTVIRSLVRDFGEPRLTYDEMVANRALLNRLLQERAEQEGFIFFDLLPILDEAAARGEMLYYTYDTHWNQDGHDLAGQALADFIDSGACER